MPKTITLPDGRTATILTTLDVPERTCQEADRVLERYQGALARLRKSGFDAEDASTWDAAQEALSEDAQFIRTWKRGFLATFLDPSFELPEDLDALPRAILSTLVDACFDAYIETPDFTEGAITDPKARDAASAD